MAKQNPDNHEHADISASLLPADLIAAIDRYRKLAFEKAVSMAGYIKMLNHPVEESALHSAEKQLSLSTASLTQLVETIEAAFQQASLHAQQREFLASVATDNLVIKTLLENALDQFKQHYQQAVADQMRQLAAFKQMATNDRAQQTPLRKQIDNYAQHQTILINHWVTAIKALLNQLRENTPTAEKNVAAQLEKFESTVDSDDLEIGMQLRSLNVLLNKIPDTSALIDMYEALELDDNSPPESPRPLRSALTDFSNYNFGDADANDTASQTIQDITETVADEIVPETIAPIPIRPDEPAITYLGTTEFIARHPDAENDDIVNYYTSDTNFDELDLDSLLQLYTNLSDNAEQLSFVKSHAAETEAAQRPTTPARKILKLDSPMALANFVAALKNPDANSLIMTNPTVLNLEYIMQGLKQDERAHIIELICNLLKQKHSVKELLLAHNHFSANELQLLANACYKAKSPATSLQLVDLKHSVDSKDPNALNQLIPFRRAFDNSLRLDPLTERQLKQHESAQLKNASVKYMKHLRNAILPAFKKSGYNHSYSINLSEAELMKQIVNDALTKKTSPAASEMHNNKFATRIKKYHYLLELLSVLNNHPNDPVKAFYKKYEAIKSLFPKNTAPEDKASELEFYRSIQEKVALQRIEKVGFFHHDIKPTTRPTTAAAKKPRPPSS